MIGMLGPVAGGLGYQWASWSARRLVRIEGAFDANADASAERVIKGLRSAFDSEKVTAMVLEIDSPGAVPSRPR